MTTTTGGDPTVALRLRCQLKGETVVMARCDRISSTEWRAAATVTAGPTLPSRYEGRGKTLSEALATLANAITATGAPYADYGWAWDTEIPDHVEALFEQRDRMDKAASAMVTAHHPGGHPMPMPAWLNVDLCPSCGGRGSYAARPDGSAAAPNESALGARCPDCKGTGERGGKISGAEVTWANLDDILNMPASMTSPRADESGDRLKVRQLELAMDTLAAERDHALGELAALRADLAAPNRIAAELERAWAALGKRDHGGHDLAETITSALAAARAGAVAGDPECYNCGDSRDEHGPDGDCIGRCGSSFLAVPCEHRRLSEVEEVTAATSESLELLRNEIAGRTETAVRLLKSHDARLDALEARRPTTEIAPVRVRLVGAGGRLPEYMTAGAAAADLRAAVTCVRQVEVGGHWRVPLGVALELPPDTVGLVLGRSGGFEGGVIVHPGTIDPDYRGEIHALLKNHGREAFKIKPGERIAQLLILPKIIAEFVVVGAISDTDRGERGFGHTGVE